MMLLYRVELAEDENGVFLVSCPAFPEVATFGDTRPEALLHAQGALEEAIAATMADNERIPDALPSSGESTPLETTATSAIVKLPTQTSIKVLLWNMLKDTGVNRSELARRLGWPRNQVDRLFNLNHATRLDQFDQAFEALGKDLDVAAKSTLAA